MNIVKYTETEITFHLPEHISEFCEYLIDQGQDIIVKWEERNSDGSIVEQGAVVWASYAAKIKDEQIILKSVQIKK